VMFSPFSLSRVELAICDAVVMTVLSRSDRNRLQGSGKGSSGLSAH
jgi:hypothetical protein